MRSLLLLCFLFTTGCAATSSPTGPYLKRIHAPEAVAQRWVPVVSLSDEFNGDQVDLAKWQIDPLANGWGWEGRAPGLFRAENVRISDGSMNVTVSALDAPVESGGKTFTHQGAIVRSIHPGEPGWYFETRMKANATEMSSTFWLMSPPGAPRRELDIQECIGRVTEYTTHWGTNWNYLFHSNLIYYLEDAYDPDAERVQIQDGFELDHENHERYHVYAAWWKSPREIRFYLDGKYMYSLEPGIDWDLPSYLQMAIEVYDWNPLPPDGGLVESGTLEQRTTRYDWIRVWRVDDEAN